MDEEKFNKSNDPTTCTSKHVSILSKSGESNTEINPMASRSSIKPQKSYSLLSALVRRTKLKSEKMDKKIRALKQSDTVKINTSNSTIGSCSTEALEMGINKVGENGREEKIRNIEMTDSEQSLPSSSKIKRRFFSKFLKKHVLPETKKKSGNVYAIEGDQKLDQSITELKDALEKANQNTGVQFIPTSFIQLEKPVITSSLTQGLMSVQNLASRLQQSEGHLMQVFTKYVTDVSLQKELVDTLCLHSQLHLETERMNNVLSMEMWLKQIEIEKVQETALQEALNSVIRQNRQLQSEYEILFCTYERLLKKFKNFNERDLSTRSIIGCDPQIQDIIKHNIKLTHKTDLLYQQIERLESELTNFRKQNETLENQLTNSVVQCHDLEAVFLRSRADYELEMATLNHRLKSKEKILVNAIETCNKLKKELICIEDQLDGIPLPTDWKKLKCNEENVSDFIEVCRICLTEFTKEICTLRKQICVKDKEIEMLMETNGKLQENLRKSTTELDGLTRKIDDSDKLIAEHRFKCLEADMKLKEEKLERLKLDSALEKNTLSHKIEELETLINEKIGIIEQSNIYINNISAENAGLRHQIDNLNKLLKDSGSGDIIRVLGLNQEQINKLDFHCSQLANDKNQLLTQLEYLSDAQKKLVECQNTHPHQISKQQADIESLVNEKRQLQQKYEAERHTVISLQAERKKYLDEKALIKTFFHQMKSEITRLQKLEGTVTDISTEANKLAMVAEYNKELGKKLKSELEEKDKTIVKLRFSVEKLNDIQMKNTKEKMSLCHELSELCQMKEKLNSELSWEVQKNLALDDAKNEIAETAHNQLQQYEEFHRKERVVLKDLLKDLKCVVRQRNSFLEDKENLIQELEILNKTKSKQIEQIDEQRKQIGEHQKQIEEQRTQAREHRKIIEEQLKKIDELNADKKRTEEKLRDLEDEQEDNKSTINKLQNKLVEELKTYDGNIKEMETLIFELRKERGLMDDTIKYLQNNTQKLHTDLNITRSNEKDLKDTLNRCLTEQSSIKDDLHVKEKQIESLSLEKDKLMKEINQVNMVCEKILEDFENNINCTIKKEEMYKKELNESQKAIINITKENEVLTKEIASIRDELRSVEKGFIILKEQEQNWNTLVQTLENKKEAFKDVVNQHQKLQQKHSALQDDYEIAKADLNTTKYNCDSLLRQSKVIIDQKKSEIMNYKLQIEELIKENREIQEIKEEEIIQLKSDTDDLHQKLENERSSYAALSQIHKEVSTKFLKSIKDIVEEKNARHDAERNFKEFKESFEKIKTEKDGLKQEIELLTNDLAKSKNHIDSLTQEKENCQISLSDVQKKYDELEKNCLILRDQITESQSSTDWESEEIKMLQKENGRMKKESEETHKIIMSLQKDISQLQQQITALEFQKSEGTLRLHELQRKFETEQSLCLQLKTIQKIVLTEILKMKDEGVVDQEQCNCLINLIRNDSASELDVEDADVF